MQCASSITSSPARSVTSGSTSRRKAALAKRSGATSSTSSSSLRNASVIVSHSPGLSLAIRCVRTPPRSAAAIWLRISPRSGETSNVGPGATRAEQRGGDEVDRALAPPRPLHHQHPPPFGDERLDGLPLIIPEARRLPNERTERSFGFLEESIHVRTGCHARETAQAFSLPTSRSRAQRSAARRPPVDRRV